MTFYSLTAEIQYILISIYIFYSNCNGEGLSRLLLAEPSFRKQKTRIMYILSISVKHLFEFKNSNSLIKIISVCVISKVSYHFTRFLHLCIYLGDPLHLISHDAFQLHLYRENRYTNRCQHKTIKYIFMLHIIPALGRS